MLNFAWKLHRYIRKQENVDHQLAFFLYANSIFVGKSTEKRYIVNVFVMYLLFMI